MVNGTERYPVLLLFFDLTMMMMMIMMVGLTQDISTGSKVYKTELFFTASSYKANVKHLAVPVIGFNSNKLMLEPIHFKKNLLPLNM